MQYTFVSYTSIYDPDLKFYALKEGGVEKDIEGVKYMEVSTDFEHVQFVRRDSLKSTGESIVKEYR